MRLLFTIDTKDYDPAAPAFVRPSVRAIIRRDGRVAMVHSLKYDYYKFPGGGMEPGETREEALAREVLEESGLTVDPASVTEYGYVHRVSRNSEGGPFIQENYYYLCGVLPGIRAQRLDGYEAEERFTLEIVPPEDAIRANRNQDHGPKARSMYLREARVLELLLQEGLL